jgi:hypothetical protein
MSGVKAARALVSCVGVALFLCGAPMFACGDLGPSGSDAPLGRHVVVVVGGLLAAIVGFMLDQTLGLRWLHFLFERSREPDEQRRHRAELEALLEQELGFLKRSANAYDDGDESEATRLAATIRVLVHDTPQSKSLLARLGRKRVPWLDTCEDEVRGNLLAYRNLRTYQGLIMVYAGGPELCFVAKLDAEGGAERWTSFERWWNREILTDSQGRTLTRRTAILSAVEGDMGAGAAPSFTFRVPGAYNASIRQIAHEVIRTLDDDYTKKPDPQGGRFSEY